MLGFCLWSSVPAAPITQEMAAAALCSLRRCEAWWRWAGRPLMTDGPCALKLQAGVVHDGIVALPGFAKVQVVPVLPDAPQDVAYHTVDAGGDPYGLISWAAVLAEGGSLMGPGGLLEALTHEMLEALVDPTCRQTVPLPSGGRTPLEVCDWVQGSAYEELPGHFVANAVGPRFFTPGETGALDLASDVGRGAVTRAFEETPDGYHEVIADDGSVSQVFGERMRPAVRARLERTGPRGGLVRARRVG